MSDPLFLGFDLSTQQLKAIVIDNTSQVVYQANVHFASDLTNYKTSNGVIHSEGHTVTSPVAMWIEALDLVMSRLKEQLGQGVTLGNVVALGGSAQQHASVYHSASFSNLLANLDDSLPLVDQLTPAGFTIQQSPIWMDSSTEVQCKILEDAIGGPQTLADITGSRAYERFSGPQICKIRSTRPEAYAKTARIGLASSLFTSLFVGYVAPIEVSDASGMNLMDVLKCEWDAKLLEACGGPELFDKLGRVQPVKGGQSLSAINKYWVNRWGFSEKCIVAPFTGDNPATVVALSAVPGDALLSLGTSTTFLLSVPPSHDGHPPQRFTTSHLLAHPVVASSQIAMLCYKNGALAREHVRDTYADRSWEKYNSLIEETEANTGWAGLYFPQAEIIPAGVHGEFFFKIENNKVAQVQADQVPKTLHPRLILESQFLSIKSRIEALTDSPLRRLVVTGGSSANPVIRQMAADIFGISVYVSTGTKEAAAVGGAVLAQIAFGQSSASENQEASMEKVATPREDRVKAYEALVPIYRECEEIVIGLCGKK